MGLEKWKLEIDEEQRNVQINGTKQIKWERDAYKEKDRREREKGREIKIAKDWLIILC